MNTSVESLTHKMQRAAVGKMVDVVLSHADKDRQKTVGQLVDVAKQFYGSSFSAEAYEHARQTLTDPDSKWSKLINCVLDQTDPNVARTMALNLGYQRRMNIILWVSVVVLVILVQIFQSIGTCLAVRFDRRIGPGGKRRRRKETGQNIQKERKIPGTM